MGFETALISKAYVFHKRRIDWEKFQQQVNKFGKARPILNQRYPKYNKLFYWFPTLFSIGLVVALFLNLIGFPWLLGLYLLYILTLFVESLIETKSLKIAFLTINAVLIQFFGYGAGFLKSFYLINIRKQQPEAAMPEMFFK